MAAPASVAVVAALAGTAAAASASRWFPIGSASTIEPSPGIDVDVSVAIGVAVVVVALVTGLCMWSVRASRRLRQDTPAPAVSLVGTATATWPLRISMGTRLALEGGSGRSSTNGRSALLAGVLGVTGVVGALMFSAGITDATNGYRRFGQTFELATFYGEGGQDFSDSKAELGVIAADPDVDGTMDALNDVASSTNAPVSLFTYDPVGAPIDVVVTEGRLPVTDSEIALAPASADSNAVGVGDTISLSGPIGTSELTVTGVAFVPAGPHNDYSDGGWVLPGAFHTLFDGFRFHFGLVSTAPGVDPQVVADRLAIDGIMLGPGPIFPPTQRFELQELRTVPLLLAGFLALLGIGAIAHTLASTARRRRHDFAMLRALGMRPRDTTLVVFFQAGVLALASLVIGVPAGVLLGRVLWRSVALDTPVQFLAPDAWPVLVLVSCGAVAVAGIFAIWPSRRLAKAKLGSILRYE